MATTLRLPDSLRPVAAAKLPKLAASAQEQKAQRAAIAARADKDAHKQAVLRRRAEYAASAARLRALSPLVFSDDAPLPLAIGIDKMVKREAGLSARQTGYFLHWWTRRSAYQRALAAGGPRYGFDGKPQGTIAPEQVSQAREELDKRDAADHARTRKSGPALAD